MKYPSGVPSSLLEPSNFILGSIVLCQVMEVNIDIDFGDLIIRCMAHGDGSPAVVDLMFSDANVQKLLSVAPLRCVGAVAEHDSESKGRPFAVDPCDRSSPPVSV